MNNQGIISGESIGGHMSTYISAYDEDAAEKLGLEIYKMAEWVPFPRIAIICIGTDRATGDSLGPITGEMLESRLKDFGVTEIKLFGTLKRPVHALNLPEAVSSAAGADTPFIIAVDACLGDARRVGYLSTGRGAVLPGAAMNKALPKVGDIYVTGIVNSFSGRSGEAEQALLQGTRLNLVMKMARVIAGGILFGVRMITWSGSAYSGILPARARWALP
jgi:putative sporulation protein YyaC